MTHLRLLLRVDGVGEKTLEAFEHTFDSYGALNEYISKIEPSEAVTDLKGRINGLSDKMITDIKEVAKTAMWALSEAPPIGDEDYELILGMAALNKGYADLIPHKTEPRYKEMVTEMIQVVYTTTETRMGGITVLDIKRAMDAFDVSELTLRKYLTGKSKPGYYRLNTAIAKMAWDWKRSRFKKEVKEMVKEKVEKKVEKKEEIQKEGEKYESEVRAQNDGEFTMKVTRVIESRAEASESRTVVLEPTGPIECSKVQLKLVETPDKQIEDAIGYELDLGDEFIITITKSTEQTTLDIKE